jgi:hypothetical protein
MIMHVFGHGLRELDIMIAKGERVGAVLRKKLHEGPGGKVQYFRVETNDNSAYYYGYRTDVKYKIDRGE